MQKVTRANERKKKLEAVLFKEYKKRFFFLLRSAHRQESISIACKLKMSTELRIRFNKREINADTKKKKHKIIDKNMRQNANYKNTNETYPTGAPKLITL